MSVRLDAADASELLRELVKWTRVGFYTQVRTMLAHVLADEKDRLIYSMCDGKNTSVQIRKAATVSPNRVAALMKQCESLGLMATNDFGRRIGLFDLADFELGVTGEGEDDK